ncbi:MAG: N-acetylmuramoyl-L-alanine amidase [bacterium]
MKGAAFLFSIILFFTATVSAFATTIVDSSMDSSQKMFILSTKEPAQNLHIKKLVLANPKRVVFDIDNAVLANVKAMIETPNSNIGSVKIAQFSKNPNVVRVVFTGDAEGLELIRINNIKNFIVFDIPQNKESDYRDLVYADKEPKAKDIDYFCYYENLNVILSNDIDKKKAVMPAVAKVPIVSKNSQISSTGAVWHSIKTVDLPAKYNVFNIEAFSSGIKLQGLGSAGVNSPVFMYNPGRFVIDLPNSAFQGGIVPAMLQLSATDKVRFGIPSNNTVRVVVEAKEAKDYNAIIAPDLMTVLLQKTKNLNPLDFPNIKETTLEKFEAIQQGKQVTKVIIRAKAPIAHSIMKNREEVVLNFYNLNCTDIFLKDILPTKQFKTAIIAPLNNNAKGTLWKIPIKSSSLVSTQLSEDGCELMLVIKDQMYQSRDIVIKSGSTVMLDAGHGGPDVGASREGFYEKDITLELVKELQKYLESKGVNVVTTRDSDAKVTLEERVEKANSAQPEAFISVHVNATKNADVSGVETHWYKPNSRDLAKIVHNNLSLGVEGFDRGTFQSQFYVINHTVMPAVLVEVGFISNCKERCDMMKLQRKYATVKSVGNGILLYLAMNYENEIKGKANAK